MFRSKEMDRTDESLEKKGEIVIITNENHINVPISARISDASAYERTGPDTEEMQ